MDDVFVMDDVTTDGAAAAGTTAVDPQIPQASNVNQMPRNTGGSPPNIHMNASSSDSSGGLWIDEGPPFQVLVERPPSTDPDDSSSISLSPIPTPTKRKRVEAFNALLASLESDDERDVPTEDRIATVGEAREVPNGLLETSPEEGLTDEEVLARRRRYGWNAMKEESHSHLKTFLMFFVGPIQGVMLLAFVLAAALQDWIDLGVIAGLLLLNAIVGFLQDYQAGNTVNRLKKTLAQKSAVLRNGGTLAEVEVISLVPGDIVYIDEGTIVPADGTLLTADAHMQVDQSSITGESLAAKKNVNEIIYQSSTIKRGEGYMMVTAIGGDTFVGRSATLVNAAAASAGHFTQVLRSIGGVLLVFVVITLFVVWVSSFYRSIPTVRILTFTLAVTIVGVPVGLPAVVTTTMAVGASYLAKKRAIVQKLSAIESLAGAEILCTDKTGTLTRNKLTLGEPYALRGISRGELLLIACIATSRKKRGIDAIDKVLLKAAKRYPELKDELMKYETVDFTPFDPISKKVIATVQSRQGERIICAKGAPASIMRLFLEDEDEDDPTPQGIIQEYNEKVAEFASRGFRSLGVARKRSGFPWQLVGIVPCSDPPRHDTGKTIREAIDLGLKVKMLTGDAVGIAKETLRQLGLGEKIYNSERLGLGGGGDMPGSAIYDFVEAADGFAEVFPQHKYNVVDILQQRGHLVAMTGDGVNDAPSLKKADTGIAVEGSSDAARSAADIVFLAPGLSAIIDAIKTSRQIFHRMHAYVVYRIALSLHMEIFLGLWIAIYNESLNIQLVVFIAIFADIATLTIAYDKAPFSRTPVKWNFPKLWGISIIMGLILAGASFICLTTMTRIPIAEDGIVKGGIAENYGKVDSILFLEIALSQNWLIFITRAEGPFWKSWPSWQLISAVLTVDVVATMFCVFGLLNGGQEKPVRHLITTARVWVFSFGVFCLMAGVYYLLNNLVAFDRIMHGKWPCKRKNKNKSIEDLAFAVDRLSRQHAAHETV